jgi:hypothetical protein
METTELLEALEVVLTVMGVLTVLILGVLVAGCIMIYQDWKMSFTDEEGKKRK